MTDQAMNHAGLSDRRRRLARGVECVVEISCVRNGFTSVTDIRAATRMTAARAG